MDRHHSIPPMHPGELLREDVLPALDVSKAELARTLGISRQTLYDLINERQPVTAEMAVRLGKALGSSPRFWLDLQRAFDLAAAERSVDVSRIPRIAAVKDPDVIDRPRG
ncbi:HigA family addiction module antitoxin [Amorphus sp. 3PC139-8]|uniref:HigA family addiction module antitoxin n=1 Tax=Amorphus sp. 3PC139-8 TaxID=2735676 RepID=UPI00345D2A86